MIKTLRMTTWSKLTSYDYTCFYDNYLRVVTGDSHSVMLRSTRSGSLGEGNTEVPFA